MSYDTRNEIFADLIAAEAILRKDAKESLDKAEAYRREASAMEGKAEGLIRAADMLRSMGKPQ